MEKYAFLYADIENDARRDPLVKELLSEIKKYLRINSDLKFEKYEPTVRALRFIIKEIEENKSNVLNSGLMLLTAKKYLGETEEFEIGLKL